MLDNLFYSLYKLKSNLHVQLQIRPSLGAVGCGSPAFAELLDKKGRFSLGYEPIHEELLQAYRGKKRKCDTSGDVYCPY